jgi:hypothetical protein
MTMPGRKSGMTSSGGDSAVNGSKTVLTMIDSMYLFIYLDLV